MMEFRTQRLWVRPFRPEDRENMLDLLTDHQVKQTYMLPDFPERQGAMPLFERLLALSNQPDRYVAGICLEDTCIGLINETDRDGGSIELGYALLPRFHGRGYCTEALTGAIDHLFRQGFEEVLAGAFECNPASLRVMEKSGMKPLDRWENIEYRGKVHRCVYRSIRRDGT